MHIYLSEFEVARDTKRDPMYDEAVQAVVKFCQANGVRCARRNKYTEYSEIEEQIRAADTLVAIIDEYWTSSTWKLHELTFAAGVTHAMVEQDRKRLNMNIIVLLVGKVNLPWLKDLPNIKAITGNVDKLISTLRDEINA